MLSSSEELTLKIAACTFETFEILINIATVYSFKVMIFKIYVFLVCSWRM